MIVELALYLAALLMLVGAVFSLLATIGVLRFPDLLTRMHAASKAGAVGGGLLLLAVALVSQDAAVALRAILGILFLLLTTPVAAHLLARVTYQPAEESGQQVTPPPE
ncbi:MULTISPECIES: monovalent cation/H(+) antiporter subunit G [unclassified Devosia]|jgi:multicomponent Na+:H+ antiporter subunit G|uniref:monovalent cation/H(+) antiporter subunit G n=1 Tax=unclassified Devosia TaxID=196773 RepID=UPI000FDB4A50|nr:MULTISPECIES: monovalent cation/H(+) antiporter subunit G [unclassified Devosia]